MDAGELGEAAEDRSRAGVAGLDCPWPARTAGLISRSPRGWVPAGHCHQVAGPAPFFARRLDGLGDEPRPGVPRTITDAQVEEVVVGTLEEVPPGATHWSQRELARQVGISPASVRRIWRAFGLQLWRTEHFKISPDPAADRQDPRRGRLDLAPPDGAGVFAVDESRS